MTANLLEARVRVPCNPCGDWTWHTPTVRETASLPIINDETGHEYDAIRETWEIFRCLGCSDLTLKHSVEYPWARGNVVVTYFPERWKTKRQFKTYEKLPTSLTALYAEVIEAFNRKLNLLCAGGLRALLEGVCSSRGITEGLNSHGVMTSNLEGRINGLSQVVPAGIVGNLHGFRFLGNRALHDLEYPTKEDLDLAITVIEDILNIVYELNYRSARLLAATSRPVPAAATQEASSDAPTHE